jgi:peptidyl-Lys metalloendopeptidase
MIGASGNVVIGGATISAEALARADALAMVEKGLASLARWNEADRKHFREWFGSDSEATRQFMQQRLLKMRDKLMREKLVPGDDAHAYAHVYPNTNTVNLDGKFWSAPRDGENSRAGTLVHETTHFNDAGGTDDHAYGPDKCRALAAQYPNKAQNNADNHEYWMESLP